MNYELIALAVFVALLTLFLVLKRKNLEIQKIVWPILYFVLYRTKLGLKSMDKISKKKRLMKSFAVAGIWVGFAGMAFICAILVWNLYRMLVEPATVSGVGVVLPIPGVKGIFYVPFFYWIISILILATVHEFSHGMIARFNNVKIKSSGFAFLGVLLPIIPAAFVEPDEKDLQKKKTKQQLEVFAAGPFSNIIVAFIFLGILALIATPIANATLNFGGANITEISNQSILIGTNISVGDSIIGIDDSTIMYVEDFVDVMENKSPHEQILLKTDKGNYPVTLAQHPDKNESAYMGVTVSQNRELKPETVAVWGRFLPNALLWILGLFWWLYLLNLGIGIFNLVPVGPIDGGRMVYVSLLTKFKEAKAKQIASWISIIFLMIIVLNVLAGFVI